MEDKKACINYKDIKKIMGELPLKEKNKVAEFERENFYLCLKSVSRDASQVSNKKFSFNLEMDNSSSNGKPTPRANQVANLNFSLKPELENLSGCYNFTRSTVGDIKAKSFVYDKPAERVSESLAVIFKNESCTQSYFNLEIHEQKLVNAVIYKVLAKIKAKHAKSTKTAVRSLLSNINEKQADGDISWLIRHIINSDSIVVKRKEEKLKFIMKNTLKHFRKQFFKNQGLKYSKESELEFLNYYFKQHKEVYQLDIEHFSDPLNSSFIKNPSHKTLSSDYFKLLFGVDQFRSFFFHYLDHKFKANYQASIKKKFLKMFKDLIRDLEMGLHCDRESIFLNFVEKITKRKGIKMPWFDREIDEALIVFKRHIAKQMGDLI